MGGDINTDVVATDPMNVRLARRAAVRIADQIVAEHPDLTVAELVNDPAIVAGLRELLAVIGLKPAQIRRSRNA